MNEKAGEWAITYLTEWCDVSDTVVAVTGQEESCRI